MTNPLDHRLAEIIANGRPFTADDVTDQGAVTLDAGHTPNGGQNGIGSLFNQASRRGLIRFTGRVVRSTAPHRKGGAIREWQGTEAGLLWARTVLAPT